MNEDSAFNDMRRGLIPCIRALTLLWLMSGAALAQYHFDSLSTDDGLPQNSVLAILQARDGYLWLATNDGLTSFDGRKFTVFDSTSSRDLCCNRLTALYQDRNGALWIGTDVNKIIRYQNHQFTSFDLKAERYAYIYSITEDPTGNLVINTSRGVYCGNADGFSFDPRLGDYYFPGRSGFNWHIEKGVLIGNQVNGASVRHQLSSEPITIRTIYQDSKDQLWIGTEAGLFRLSGDRLERIILRRDLLEIQVRAISGDPEGNVWIGTTSGLFRHLDGEISAFESGRPLPSNRIASLFVGRDGLIWAGTLEHGLLRINKTVISTISQSSGLPAENVYPVFQDSRGKIWIGSWPAGISIYQGGKLENFRVPGIGKFEFPVAFGEDKEERIWIATLGHLWWYKNGKIFDYSRMMPDRASVHAILPDRSGAIWFGTERGLVRSFEGKITHYTKADGLKADNVVVLLEDREGGIWIGATSGLTRFFEGRFVSYDSNPDLGDYHIRALHEDEEGTIWAGTFGHGLVRIKAGRITNYTRADGLYCKGVFTILDDDRGNFWMSCNWGIYRVSKLQLKEFAEGTLKSIISVPYGRKDGMKITECNGGSQNSGILSTDGKLWFPTMGGVAVIDLAKDLPPPITPALAIKQVVAGERTLEPDESTVLAPSNGVVEIHYDSLCFFKPEKMRFRYMMEGLDRHWINAGDQRIAIYSFFPPGAYRFRLAASFDGGQWYELENRLSVIVDKPFWITWWFIAGITLLAILIGYLWYRHSVSKLIRQSDEQRTVSRKMIDSLENERRKIARELHDDVVNHLASLAVGVFNISNQVPPNNSNLKQRMVDIHDEAMKLTDNIRNLSHSLHPVSLQYIGLLPAIRSICNEFAASDKAAVKLHLDESLASISPEADICLYRIVQECLRNVAKHARAGNVLVSLRAVADKAELIISDDGVGFDIRKARLGEGLGLISIQERVDSLGGNFRITSEAGRGVVITATIPLNRKQQ